MNWNGAGELYVSVYKYGRCNLADKCVREEDQSRLVVWKTLSKMSLCERRNGPIKNKTNEIPN